MDTNGEMMQSSIPPQDQGDMNQGMSQEQSMTEKLYELSELGLTSKPPNGVKKTLGIIKPDAMDRAEEIINVLRREGLAILETRRVQLTPEQAAEFYQDMYENEWFGGAVANLSSGPILAMILCGPEVVRHWLKLIGPPGWKERSVKTNCLRFQYGKKDSDSDNALHGSANEEDALRELHFFFPEVRMDPIPSLLDSSSKNYLNQNVHPVLTVGLSKLIRERPEDPVMWLADWLLQNNPNKPKELNSGNGACA